MKIQMRPTGRILFYKNKLSFGCRKISLINNAKQKFQHIPKVFSKDFKARKNKNYYDLM